MKRPVFEIYKRAPADWRWRLKAANGEIIASGEGYKRKAGARRGVDAVISCAEWADVKVIDVA